MCTVCLSTVAQERITMQQYREMVAAYSLQLKMSAENSVAQSEKLKMVKTGYYPSLSLAANGNYTVGNNINLGGMALKDYNYNSNLSLQQNVYTGGAVRNQTKAAKMELSIAELGQQSTLQGVIYTADMAYLALAASARQLSISTHYVDIVRDFYDIVNIRFRDGYVSRTDLLMVETRLNEAKLQEIAARKLYMNSVERVNTLLGRYESREYAVDSLAGQKYMMPEGVNLDFALENRPDYKASEWNVKLAEQNIRLARSKFNPQFVVGVQGVFGTPSLNFTGDPKGYGAAYAQLSVPLFMWGERRHSVAMMRASSRAAQYSLVDHRDAVNGEISSAKINLDQSYEQAIIAASNLEISQENLELNTFSYSEGKLPILDVLQSQLSWIQSYTSMVSSIYNYRVAVTDFEKAIGVLSLSEN